MKTTIQSVKGTREFYPEEMAIRTWLYRTIREVSESFGFEEWEGPFLEKIDLYAAKSGEELVKEQSFVFEDRGGDPVTLRPELTPTLARMVAQRQRSLVYPLRWWSFGPFWRYERPQKGRTREFFQWNIDIIGMDVPEVDAEMVAICASFFKKVGYRPDQVQIVVNNRRLMDQVLLQLEIPKELHSNVFRLIDKKGKLSTQEWKALAFEQGLTENQFDGLRDMLGSPDLWMQSEELVRVMKAVEAFGLKEYVSFDPKIIRGLDYYTGTVFEAIHLEQGGRSILGGGRYDNLVEDVGGEPLSGVGFAMGDVLIQVLLKEDGLIPELTSVPAKAMVAVFDEGTQLEAIRLSSEMREAGINTMIYPQTARLGKQYKYADRLGMRFVLLCGPDEIKKGVVSVKDLKTGEQQAVLRNNLVEMLQENLAAE